MHITKIYGLVAGALLFFTAGTAEASSGWLRGTLFFHNKNGAYCPSTDACTGALYREASYDELNGIPNAEVHVLRASDNAVIGSGTTNWKGDYLASWSSGTGTSNVAVKLRVRYRNKDGVYVIQSLNQQTYSSTGGSFTAIHGTTSSNPQQASWYWGTSSSPNAVANVYWAGWYLYARIASSSRMKAYFTDVDVLAFDTTAITSCDTSCARGQYRNMSSGRPSWAEQKLTVVLDGSGSTPYNPLNRMMHELGHIADFVSGPNQGHRRSTGYGYDGNTSWQMASSEYRPSALTEGFATFLSQAAFYHDFATNPRQCSANGHGTSGRHHCYPGNTITDWSVEDGNFGSCATEEGRQALNHVRFFWDIYDEVNDDQDDIDLDLFQIFDAQAVTPCPNYPACYGDGQLHNQYSSVTSTLSDVTVNPDDEDQNNAWDWRKNMLNNYTGGHDVSTEYFSNCLGYY